MNNNSKNYSRENTNFAIRESKEIMKNTDIGRSEYRDPDDEPLSITSNEVSKIG
jgi:hypothetical protein